LKKNIAAKNSVHSGTINNCLMVVFI